MWRVIRIDKTSFGRRLGRRGLVLLFCGLSWTMIGVEIDRHPNIPRFANPDNHSGAQLLLNFMDRPELGLLWIVTGGIAAIYGLMHNSKLFKQHDSIGFNLILIPAMVWLMGFIYSFFTAVFTHGTEGRYEALYGAVVWVLISLFILVIAGWPEGSPDVRSSLNRDARRRVAKLRNTRAERD